MRPSASLSVAVFIRFASAQWWGEGGYWGSNAPSCVQSCISSGYPTHTSNWDSFCATPTAGGVPNCLTASCFGPHTVPASAYTSVESSICSAYSSCASLSRSQTGPYPSECGYLGYGEGPWGLAGAAKPETDGILSLEAPRIQPAGQQPRRS